MFKQITGVIIAIVALLTIMLSSKLFEYNDAGNVLFIQSLSGNLGVYTDQGYKNQFFGSTERWRKSNQFDFSQNPVRIRFNDGGHANLSGSVRYDLPTDEKKLSDLYATFKTQEAFEKELVRTVVEKSIYMTGPLMTSKESSASKRPDLLRYIEDQASLGIYRTTTEKEVVKDELTNEEKQVEVVKVQQEGAKAPRQEESPLIRFGVRLYNMAVNDVKYDNIVESQIAAQQKATMEIQTAMAEAKKAEQEAITVEQTGKAAAAKAKWEQEVKNATIKAEVEQKRATALMLAEQEKEVAELAAQKQKTVAALALETAKLEAQSTTEVAQAEAKAAQLKMQANGALEQKLEALVKIAEVNATAIQNYKGNLVPSVIVGGKDGAGGTGTATLLDTFLNVKLAESMKNLGVDLSLPQTPAQPTAAR